MRSKPAGGYTSSLSNIVRCERIEEEDRQGQSGGHQGIETASKGGSRGKAEGKGCESTLVSRGDSECSLERWLWLERDTPSETSERS